MNSISLAFHDQFKHCVAEVEDVAFELLSMAPGQELATQQPSLHLGIIALSGHIRISNERTNWELIAPHMIAIDPKEKLSITAIEKSTTLLVKIPKADVLQNEDTSLDHENAYKNPALKEKVAPEIRPLVEDHVEVCKTLESFKKASSISELAPGLQLIRNELNHHFVAEEQLLFPLMAKHVGGIKVGPVARLIEEHKIIRTLYGEVEALFKEVRQDPTGQIEKSLDRKLRSLSKALLNHLGKEDSHLFPMASRLLTQEEKNSIKAQLPEYMG